MSNTHFCVPVAHTQIGYDATITMLGESALCLVEQREQLAKRIEACGGGRRRGGVVTTAFAFGHVLINRLNQVGIKFELVKE